MPRIKKTTTVETDEDEEQIETVDEEGELEHDVKAVATAFNQDGGRVQIWRRPPGSIGNPIWSGELPTMDLVAGGADTVAKAYGGGRYQLRFLDRNGKYLKQITFDIDPRLKGDLDQKSGGEKSNGDGKATEILVEKLARKEGDFTALLVQMMQQQAAQQQQTMQMFIAAMQQPKAQPNAWKDIAAALTPLAPAFVELVKSKSSNGGVKETVELLVKSRELFADSGGGSDGNAWIGKLIEALGPTVAQAVAAKAGQPAPENVVAMPEPAASVVTVAPPVAQLPPTPPEPAPNPTDPDMWKKLVIANVRPYYAQMLAGAKNGSDPMSYFEFIADGLSQAPAQATEALVEILLKPDWAQLLFAVNVFPDGTTPWFVQLRDAFLEEYGPKATPAEAPTVGYSGHEPPAGSGTFVADTSKPLEKPKEPKGGKK